jgi:hypothetical protein
MQPNCRGSISDTVALADLFASFGASFGASASAIAASRPSIAVGHTSQNVAISGLIAGNQELIWL